MAEERSVTQLLTPSLPQTPISEFTRPFVRFMHIESSSGIVLLICAAIALMCANTPTLADGFEAIWNIKLVLAIGEFTVLDYKGQPFTLGLVINDILMAIFFFLVGLEIKRELVTGELRDPRRVALPIAAAIGGVAAPIVLFFCLQPGGAAAKGWAIPMATDIAFVVGCLALLGKRVPSGLKIMLLTLAIVDDLLAVLVIAVFYTDQIDGAWLTAGLVGFLIIVILNRVGVRTVGIYIIVGGGIWLCALKSGIHPTVAGAMLGLLTPANAWIGRNSLIDILSNALKALKRDEEHDDERQLQLRRKLDLATRESVSPLERLQLNLHGYVAFVIMPLFALSNAGVEFSTEGLTDQLSIAIATGLLIGKPLGIVLLSWLVVRLGWAALPTGVNWQVMVGAGLLSGIGFTMSMFIANLAFYGESSTTLPISKSGILVGSFISAMAGLIWLWFTLPRPNETTPVATAASQPANPVT